MNGAYAIAVQRADASEALWSDGHGLEALAMARDAYESATLAAGEALGDQDPGERAARFLALGVAAEDVQKAENAYVENAADVGAASADLLRVVRAVGPSRTRPLRAMALALLLGALAVAGAMASEERTSEAWTVQFYPSPGFRGTALRERVHALDYRWGTLAPRRELPADGFSMRADVCLVLDEPAVLHMRLASDDRARVFVDHDQHLGSWQEQAFTQRTRRLALAEGAHELRVEYSDASGEARLELDLALSAGALEDVLRPRPAEGCGELAESTRLNERRRRPALPPFLRALTPDAGPAR